MRNKIRLMKNIRNDKKGSIEGLPLQLMIMIVIATMGTAILIGWMGSIDSPKHIGSVDITSDDIVLNGNYTDSGIIEIYVTDQDGNPLRGATVVLSGLGVTDSDGKTAYCNTDSAGRAHFDGLRISLRGSEIGFITVNVSMSEYGENNTARVAVIA
jgi:Protocatechuate 3,4-dioxygenase beta subunit